MTRATRIRRCLGIIATMRGHLQRLDTECQRLRTLLRIEADPDIAEALQRASSRADQLRRRLARLRAGAPARQFA